MLPQAWMAVLGKNTVKDWMNVWRNCTQGYTKAHTKPYRPEECIFQRLMARKDLWALPHWKIK